MSLPVFTFVDKSTEDDVAFSGCKYCDDTVNDRRNDNANYIDYWWVADFVREPLAEALSIPLVEIDAMPAYPDVYDRTDVYVTHAFEGIPYNDTFDNNTYLEMRSMQKIELVYMFTRDTRRLAFSRMWSKPMDHMQWRIDELLGKNSTADPLRYVIYSAHDDQISNIMEWLHPTNIV